MTKPSLTALIGKNNLGDKRWSTFVDGGDGFWYGIPYHAPRVVKFDPLSKSSAWTEIGPDFGDGIGDEYDETCAEKWSCGLLLANNGSIYYAPFNAEHILKININDGTVETLDNVELPETSALL